jgi:DNA-directed RNA polymerase specialized sigma24 family protein
VEIYRTTVLLDLCRYIGTMVVDTELSLTRLRLDRWAQADKRARLGQGYPTASPIYRLMRDGTAIQAPPGRLDVVERATELDLEIEETQAAIDRLPPYLKDPLILAYLDPRETADKLLELNVSQRKYYDTLDSARQRLTGKLYP